MSVCILPPPIRSEEGGYVLGSVDFCQLGYSKYCERISVKFLNGLGIAQLGSDQIVLAFVFSFWVLDHYPRLFLPFGDSSCFKSLVVAAFSADV